MDDRPVSSVPIPAYQVLDECDLYPDESNVPDWEFLLKHFKKEGRISPAVATRILTQAKKVMDVEPNVLRLKGPVNIVGDIHGQFYDLANMLGQTGTNTPCLFLGDYVDRGNFGCEVTLLLCALKINYPTSFWMIRGNHECRLLASHFNFKAECLKKFNASVFEAFMKAFDALPLAATVTVKEGTYYCVHGGLSPSIHTIDQVNDINRFIEPPTKGPLCDLLWSDPLEDDTAVGLTEDEMGEWYDVSYEENPTRGCGYIFGYTATVKFLQENNILAIIRAHEVQREGFTMATMNRTDGSDPMVITVFSAPNYCDYYGNTAAFLRVGNNKVAATDFIQFSEVEHPFWFPSCANAVDYTIMHVLERIADMFQYFASIEGVQDEDMPDYKAPTYKIRSSTSPKKTKKADSTLELTEESSEPVEVSKLPVGVSLRRKRARFAQNRTESPKIQLLMDQLKGSSQTTSEERSITIPENPSVGMRVEKLHKARQWTKPTRAMSTSRKILSGLFRKKLRAYAKAAGNFELAKLKDLVNEHIPDSPGTQAPSELSDYYA
mmetsp:Transcript_29884/g.33353  ORF Transcript_29884/g.33353 Transcript_29884/m.33353 type:complete len:550 (+) Transcript_29884:1-1650(+)